MKAIAETIGVACSNLAKREKGCSKKRGPYLREADAGLLPQIRTVLDERTSYSYRRVGATLNRRRTDQGLPPLNHKRI